MKAYRCAHCEEVHQYNVTRCTKCKYPVLEEFSMSPEEYCRRYGHDAGEKLIPGTGRQEGTKWVDDPECPYREQVWTHEYEFKCARCGLTKTIRK